MDKIIEIYNRSQLSISKFSQIIGKDRRTVSSWLNKEVDIEPKREILNKISLFFRYSDDIWKDNCQSNNFLDAITSIPTRDIKIIDGNYESRLKYILKKESEQRLVIHPQFPGPMYRDAINVKAYIKGENKDIKKLKKERIDKMLAHSYKSDEWYDIRSLLNFCFSQIGIFYTKDEKIALLDLMHDTFHDNYNKHLFLFDSFSKEIYGFDTMYTSINIQEGTMFFKSPIKSVFIEISNKEIVQRIHTHFTSVKEAPLHINPYDAINILKILKSSIIKNLTLFETYKIIDETTPYGKYIKSNINI